MRICLGQLRELTPEIAAYAKQLGVNSVQFNTPSLPAHDGTWALEDLIALKKGCDQHALRCETIENVPIEFYDKVLLGLPGRDAQIEKYIELIGNMGRAEIPILGYHFVPTFVWRTADDTPGRGGVKVTSFDGALAVKGANTVDYFARTDVAISDVEVMWDNYAYFMKAVLPAAKEAGIRLALHPDDPPVPVVANVARLFISLDAFKRAEEIARGYEGAWGLDLCLGCVSEMGGADTVRQFIDHFGPRNQICYVHFRDVQGMVPRFQECFLGEGNFDPSEVLRQLHLAGFNGYVMDDHVPLLTCETVDPILRFGRTSHAYTIGYIEGILKTLGCLN